MAIGLAGDCASVVINLSIVGEWYNNLNYLLNVSFIFRALLELVFVQESSKQVIVVHIS